MVGLVGGLGLSWQATFGVILTLYFYSHYFFASGEPNLCLPLAHYVCMPWRLMHGCYGCRPAAKSAHICAVCFGCSRTQQRVCVCVFFPAGAAHIGAMYTAFLSVAMACGTPGLMAALALGAPRCWACAALLGLATTTGMHLLGWSVRTR